MTLRKRSKTGLKNHLKTAQNVAVILYQKMVIETKYKDTNVRSVKLNFNLVSGFHFKTRNYSVITFLKTVIRFVSCG
jgi:hypothetical protein